MQWVRQPHKLWLRRALFQIHLWTGIGLGLYIVMLSVTGSAIVARREITNWLVPRSVPSTQGKRMSQLELTQAAAKLYPEYAVTSVLQSSRPARPVEIVLEKAGGKKKERLFDPYTGRDLGDSDPRLLRVLNWVVALHDDLLAGDNGRMVNGVGAVLLTVLFLSGAVIWWPGSRKWWRSLLVRPRSNWKSVNWQLHSAAGFWFFVPLLLWAVTGIYLAFPKPFHAEIEHLYPRGSVMEQRAEAVVEWLVRLHFGRFGGWGIRSLWIVLGFVPSVLVVTGLIMWCNRVLIPMRARLDESVQEQVLETARSSH
jgi:uncharacterized iron-regulated membrane protein